MNLLISRNIRYLFTIRVVCQEFQPWFSVTWHYSENLRIGTTSPPWLKTSRPNNQCQILTLEWLSLSWTTTKTSWTSTGKIMRRNLWDWEGNKKKLRDKHSSKPHKMKLKDSDSKDRLKLKLRGWDFKEFSLKMKREQDFKRHKMTKLKDWDKSN